MVFNSDSVLIVPVMSIWSEPIVATGAFDVKSARLIREPVTTTSSIMFSSSAANTGTATDVAARAVARVIELIALANGVFFNMDVSPN